MVQKVTFESLKLHEVKLNPISTEDSYEMIIDCTNLIITGELSLNLFFFIRFLILLRVVLYTIE